MESSVLIEFGQRLRELRQERGGTQNSMAAYLGCTVSKYQKIEYGQVNVSALTLIALSEYFHVSIDYLLGRSDLR